MFLVDGRSLVEILSSCCGRGGCHWHFLAPLIVHHSPCGFLYNHLYCLPTTPLQVRYILAVMAVDCGDEIPSKSKPQPAGITSCANSKMFYMFAVFLCNMSSNFNFPSSLSSFKSECIILLYFPRIFRIFFGFAVQALRVSNHGTLYTLMI